MYLNIAMFKVRYLVTLLILASITFVSCNSSQEEGYPTVEAISFSDTLRSTSINLGEQASLFEPLRIVNVDEKYVVISEVRPNNFIHVFSQPDFDLLYSWGKQGRGPGEFMTNPFYIDTNQDQLLLFDSPFQRMRFFNVKDSTLVEQPDQLIDFSGVPKLPNRITRINDTLYFADNGTGSANPDVQNEYMALGAESQQELFTFSEYPESELQGTPLYTNFIKSNVAKPDGSTFASFYFGQNMFKIYNTEGETLIYRNINDPYVKIPDGEDIIYRTTAYASDQYIYLKGLYNTSEAIYEQPDSSAVTALEVWNWQGEPVYRAYFDKAINGFTVSEKHQRIYGFSPAHESYVFLYPLPSFDR